MFVYDGGVMENPDAIQLASGELASFRFVEPDDLKALMAARLDRRARAALRALAEGSLSELENGVLVRKGARRR